MSAPACRNCGTTLVGRWCHACGQDGRDPFQAPRELVAEWFDSVWGWDSRLARTVTLLLASPGALTAEVVAGRRVRFVSALRLYLVVSAAFFASYALTPDPVLAGIAGLGDLERGVAHLTTLERWLPMMMIVIIPSTAFVLLATFRSPPRAFLEHLVFTLHFGTASFLTVSAAQLAAFALQATGAAGLAVVPVVAAHAYNASWLFLGGRRYYGLPPGATAWRLLVSALAIAIGMGGLAGIAAQLIAG